MSDLTQFTNAVTELCKAYETGAFKPLLEADVAGYLYYLLVKQSGGDARKIHLSARIPKKGERRKFPDIVIGRIWTATEQVHSYESAVLSDYMDLTVTKDKALELVRSRGFKKSLKPYVVDMEIAVEIKPFLSGFKYQQLRGRARGAKADIEALAQQVNAKQRLLLLFDEISYLAKERKGYSIRKLADIRTELDPQILIVYVGVDSNGACDWRFIY